MHDLNLTAIRDEEGILSRHFVESIACARSDSGRRRERCWISDRAQDFRESPSLLCRPEISVTLAESQAKKAAFLQEALRTLGLRGHSVWGTGRDPEKHI